MPTRKQKSKKPFLLRPNHALSIIFIVGGVLVLPFNIEIAIAILLPVISLFVQEITTHRSWKSENLLRQTILDVLMLEQIDAMRNIRYNQSVTLTIGTDDKFLNVTCVHEYTYKNESFVKKNIDIDIFNDIFIRDSADNPYKGTHFNWVKLKYKNANKEEKYQNQQGDNGYEYFKRLPDGRPHFKKSISINAEDEVTLTYSIMNMFELFSRLVWNIQELSEDMRIFVKNNTSYDLSRFVLAINHPNRAKMHDDNKDTLSDKCCLKRKTSNGDWDCEIIFDHPFLPYQGFELKWDLQNHQSLWGINR